jgi:hypothetical protein
MTGFISNWIPDRVIAAVYALENFAERKISYIFVRYKYFRHNFVRILNKTRNLLRWKDKRRIWEILQKMHFNFKIYWFKTEINMQTRNERKVFLNFCKSESFLFDYSSRKNYSSLSFYLKQTSLCIMNAFKLPFGIYKKCIWS